MALFIKQLRHLLSQVASLNEQMIIHGVFVLSAIDIAWTDRLMTATSAGRDRAAQR